MINDKCDKLDPSYQPFMLNGLVSLSGSELDKCPVRILRDTGAAVFYIVRRVTLLSLMSHHLALVCWCKALRWVLCLCLSIRYTYKLPFSTASVQSGRAPIITSERCHFSVGE